MARDRRTRKVIFENDASVITESHGIVDDMTDVRAIQTNDIGVGANITVQLSDLFDALISYTSQRWFQNQKNAGTGTCCICGKETRESIRKICGDCMDRYQDVIYNNVQESFNDGKQSITI